MLKSNNQRGLTLLEAAIAIAVLLIGVLNIVQIFPLSFKLGKTAEQTTMAINLAQAKIEELFYLGYDNLVVGTVEPKHRLAADSTNPFYHYQRQTDIEYVDQNLNYSAGETGLKKITVTVYWYHPLLKNESSQETIILISKKWLTINRALL